MTIPAESDSQHPWYSPETGKISRIDCMFYCLEGFFFCAVPGDIASVF